MSFFVGIDVAKYKRDVAIIDSDDVIVHTPTCFSNDIEGFTTLKRILDQLDQTIAFKVGIEVAGYYGRNLVSFLRNLDLGVNELNP